MFSLLSLIPGLASIVTAFFTAKTNAAIAIYQAKTGAARDVAVAAIQGQAAVGVKWWFVDIPQFLIGVAVALYVLKAVVWDKVVGSFVGCSGHPAHGTCDTFSTDPFAGDLHWVFITVITGYFGLSVADKFLNSK